jgi:hypothetical protein
MCVTTGTITTATGLEPTGGATIITGLAVGTTATTSITIRGLTGGLFLHSPRARVGSVGPRRPRCGRNRCTQTDQAHTLQGQVDKDTQRLAFRIGESEDIVVESGLYNLTQDDTPVLVHFGPDQVENWLLVRLAQPEEQQGQMGEVRCYTAFWRGPFLG